MEAINVRLKQLEKIEAELYAERQATLQRRHQEDVAIQKARHEEDQGFQARLTARDQEEDVRPRPYYSDLDMAHRCLLDAASRSQSSCALIAPAYYGCQTARACANP